MTHRHIGLYMVRRVDGPFRNDRYSASWFSKNVAMEVIWQREAGDASEAAIRLIMDDDGCVMFQYQSLDLPEWTDVDEVSMNFKFAV